MILVTGASGYLGSHLILGLLSQNLPVKACKRGDSIIPDILPSGSPFLTWVEADLEDISTLKAALEGVDTIFHCAGALNHKNVSAAIILKTNIEGTSNLVNLSLEFGIRQFFYISSALTLVTREGNKESSISLLKEFNGSLSSYVFAKIEAEKEVWRGIMEGLPATIINPGLILSSCQDLAPNPHLKHLYTQGSKYYTLARYGIIWIGDLVETLVDLLTHPRNGEQLVLISENIYNQDLIIKVNERLVLDKPSLVFKQKSWLNRILFGRHPPEKQVGIYELSRLEEGLTAFEVIGKSPVSGKVFRKLQDLF